MEPYSKEFRRDVLAACDAGGGTREVALRFNVSESWVRRIKQERRETGKTAPKVTRDRRRCWEPYSEWILKPRLERYAATSPLPAAFGPVKPMTTRTISYPPEDPGSPR